jgi:hypothetical protein
MKNPRFVVILTSFTILILLCGLPFLPRQRPDRPQLDQLLLDREILSGDWRLTYGPESLPAEVDKLAQETLAANYRAGTGAPTLGHELYRYPNEILARYFFFSESNGPKESEVPEWTYRNSPADEFAFGCRRYEGPEYRTPFTVCRAIARYGEYLSIFEATNYELTSFEELERIQQRIDQRIVELLR